MSFEQPVDDLYGVDVRSIIQSALLPDHVEITSILADPDRSKSHVSHNLRVLTNDNGNLQKILLKYNPRMQDPEHVERITAITDHLNSLGVPTPEVIRNKVDGRPYTLIPEDDQDLLFVAYQFVEGQYFSGTIEEVEQAGKALGLLHKGLASYSPATPMSDQGRGSWQDADSSHVFDEVDRILRGADQLDEFDVFVQLHMEEFRAHLTASRSEEIARFPRQLIHDDYHVQNVLFKANKVELIVDFEDVDASPAPRIWDVAFALHRFVKFYPTRNLTTSEPEAGKIGSARFLEGYRSGNPEIADDEISKIPITIRARAAMAIVENLKYRYLLGTLVIPVAELEKHLHIFEEAKLFDFLAD